MADSKIKIVVTGKDTEIEDQLRLDEIQAVKNEIAQTVVGEIERLERRKQQVIGEVSQTLKKRLPVRMTEEMKELGIYDTVFNMVQKVELHYRFEMFMDRVFGDD